jgi:ribonuclease VapC
MIVVDTSALMAILLGEPEAEHCADILAHASRVVMSAGTLAEAMIVAGHRNVADELQRLLEGLDVEIADTRAASARRVASAHAAWGKGMHPAGLNSGDCFAYEAARTTGYPLLFVGDNFAMTDVERAL